MRTLVTCILREEDSHILTNINLAGPKTYVLQDGAVCLFRKSQLIPHLQIVYIEASVKHPVGLALCTLHPQLGWLFIINSTAVQMGQSLEL